MSDRLAEIKARLVTRDELGVGRGGTAYDEAARDVRWLVDRLAALREQRCETCRHQRKDDSCARLEKADYDDAYVRGPRNYHDCDDMGRTCGAWARREP